MEFDNDVPVPKHLLLRPRRNECYQFGRMGLGQSAFFPFPSKCTEQERKALLNRIRVAVCRARGADSAKQYVTMVRLEGTPWAPLEGVRVWRVE